MMKVANPRRKLKLDLSKRKLTPQDLEAAWRKIKAEQIEFVDISLNENPIPELVLSAEYLQSVKYFYAYKSNVQSIRIVGDLPNLRVLFLKENQLRKFKLPKGFKNLEYLQLEENQLERFEVLDCKGLVEMQSVFLEGNPIKNIPPEIWSKEKDCWERLQPYLKAIQKSGVVQNNEVKVILVGNGSVGKTQIAKRIELQKEYKPTLEHESTHAIALLERKLKCKQLEQLAGGHLKLNIWDFGGQDIYHATHRMFMQSNALFLLVWDAVNEVAPFHLYNKKEYKNEPLEYWLRYIACFGGESPVLVLQNKIDRKTDRIMPKPTKDDYRRKHANIADLLEVSAWEGKGFRLLENRIERLFEPQTYLGKQLLEAELPASWVSVRNRVRAEQAKENGEKQIDGKTFREWCKEAKAEESTRVVLEFLHDTGVLFFQDRYFGSSIILNQAWAIDAVYKVLDKDQEYFEVLEGNRGRLTYRDLCEIWEKESDAERELFIRFMLDCELCFETTLEQKERYFYSPPLKDRTFIVPQLLPAEKPDFLTDGDYLEGYGYRLEEELVMPYYFLPPVFMQRFIVQAKDFANVSAMWGKGILLEDGKAHALVEADYANKQIVIQYNAVAKRFVKAIVEQLEIIAKEGKVQAMMKVNVGERDERSVFEIFIRKAKRLLGRKSAAMDELSDVRAKGLKGYEEVKTKQATPSTRLFLSYALEDEALVKEFRNQISALIRGGYISTWSEADLLSGDHKIAQSRREMEEADIVVLMVSPDYWANDEKWEGDLQKAMHANRMGKTKIVPILLRPVHSDGTIVEELQCLPKSGKAISVAENRGQAWFELVKELKELIGKNESK